MALPITHRWIAVGNVVLRNRKTATGSAPTATIDEVFAVASDRLANNKQLRQYGQKSSRMMWFSHIVERDGFYWFLAQISDQNVADFAYINVQTLKPRDVKKRANEGGHYTSHVAISKSPLSRTTGHLLLAEKVPGIHLASLKDHLTWLTHEPRFRRAYVDEKGQSRVAAPVFEVDGYESGTIGDALRGGTLQDIEFVQHIERHEDGLDEDSVVRQSVHEARWEVKQQVSTEQAETVLSRAREFLRTKFKRKSDADAKMFVRIKVEGQIRRTEVDEHDENILGQAFMRNEIVKDFDTTLAQRHDGLRNDMITKMIVIARDLSGRDTADD